jgi:rare lipoprotein A
MTPIRNQTPRNRWKRRASTPLLTPAILQRLRPGSRLLRLVAPIPRAFRSPHRFLVPNLVIITLTALALTGCHHHHSNNNVASSATAPTRTPYRRPAPIVRETGPVRPDETEGRPVSTEVGLASWYGPPYHNRQAADGSVFDQNALTVAHRTLPMGTVVRVTNLATGETVLARVTDRGPFVPGRVLDLSLAAAKAIGVYRAGIAKVKIEAFPPPHADPEGRWCVQIGTFSSSHDAIKLKNDLLRRYATAKVIEFAGPTGFWVRINPTPADHTAAVHIADSIHIPDAEPYLVRLN